MPDQERSWPYSLGDTQEPEWRRMARLWRTTGVIRGAGSELDASPVSGELKVQVQPGEAWVDGHYYELIESLELELEDADLDDDRVDTVVVESDSGDPQETDPESDDFGRARLRVLEGTPADEPEPPALTQSTEDGLWHLPLFNITVRAAASDVDEDDVEDVRQMSEAPGRVLVVDSEDDLDDVDPTYHRFAVVDPEGADGQARWYDTDAEEWKVVGPVGNVLVVEDESELSQHEPPEQRFAVVDEGDGVGSLWYFRQSTEEWVQVTADMPDALSDIDSLDADGRRITGLGDPEDDQDAATRGFASATYQPQRLKVERSNKDDDGIFRDVTYRRHDGTAWMESRLRPEGSGPEYDTREVDWFEADGTTVRDSVVYDLTYDADGDLIEETAQ